MMMMTIIGVVLCTCVTHYHGLDSWADMYPHLHMLATHIWHGPLRWYLDNALPPRRSLNVGGRGGGGNCLIRPANFFIILFQNSERVVISILQGRVSSKSRGAVKPASRMLSRNTCSSTRRNLKVWIFTLSRNISNVQWPYTWWGVAAGAIFLCNSYFIANLFWTWIGNYLICI